MGIVFGKEHLETFGGKNSLIIPLASLFVFRLAEMRNSYRPCIIRKGHQGSNPGGHSFVFLNASINNKPIFFSEVVSYKKSPRSEDRGLSYSIDNNLCGDSVLIFLEHKHEKFNTCHDDRAI
jgi:hypothetical protein